MTTTVATPIVPVMPVDQLTNAIVAAAKRTRKSKEVPAEPSIADQISGSFQTGQFTEEAIQNLTRVFEREFIFETEPIPEVQTTSEDKPIKEKKPRKTSSKAKIVKKST